MKYVKTVVCFANSRKTGGFCVAGKELHDGNPGTWIRPVSARPTHEIYQAEMRCDDGTTPHVLDVLAVPCEKHQPISHQQENHVIDPVVSWEKEGRIAWQDIRKWTDTPPSLWGLGNGSYVGLNNRLSIGQEDGTSLYLVETDRLSLLVGRKAPEYADSKRAVRGEFVYRGVNYRMDVTDPEIEREFLGKPDGQYQISRPVLCISLGDPYQGHFYKLIAAVLFKERFS